MKGGRGRASAFPLVCNLLTFLFQALSADEYGPGTAVAREPPMPSVLRLAAHPPPSEGVDFAHLFDSLPDPVVYVGPDKRIAACNRTFRDRFPVVVESHFLAPFQKQAESKEGSGRSLPHLEPKRQSIAGGKIQPALQPKVTHLASGGMLVVFRAVSAAEIESRREVDNLRKQVRNLEEQVRDTMAMVTRYKTNFANAGHELRTPLNAIVGFSEMMREQTFGPLGDLHYERYAEIMHDSGLRLLHIINDVLDFAKLDSEKLELCAEKVDLLGVAVDGVRELETLAVQSRIGVCVHLCDAASLVMGDRNRLHQMLINLLSNALKFTPPGGEICIDIYKRGESVALSVSDNGIGMREADIAIALEPFGQVKHQRRFDHAGTGLGLPLTKRLAELHGGGMEIESVSGFGTTVTILLPSAEDNLKQCSNGDGDSKGGAYFAAAR